MEIVQAREAEGDGGAADVDRQPRREAREHAIEVVDVDPDRLALGQRQAALATEATEHEYPERLVALRPCSAGIAERKIEIHGRSPRSPERAVSAPHGARSTTVAGQPAAGPTNSVNTPV